MLRVQSPGHSRLPSRRIPPQHSQSQRPWAAVILQEWIEIMTDNPISAIDARLAPMIEQYGVTNLARRSGLSENELLDLARGAVPTLDMAICIADALDVSLDWLAGRSETPEENDEDPALTLPASNIAQHFTHNGVGSGRATGSIIAFGRDWLKHQGIGPDSALVVEMVGDSMSPKIDAGDQLLVDTSQTDLPVGGIFAAVIDRRTMVLQLQTEAEDRVLATFINPAYRDILLPRSKVQLIGRVAWQGRRL